MAILDSVEAAFHPIYQTMLPGDLVVIKVSKAVLKARVNISQTVALHLRQEFSTSRRNIWMRIAIFRKRAHQVIIKAKPGHSKKDTMCQMIGEGPQALAISHHR